MNSLLHNQQKNTAENSSTEEKKGKKNWGKN